MGCLTYVFVCVHGAYACVHMCLVCMLGYSFSSPVLFSSIWRELPQFILLATPVLLSRPLEDGLIWVVSLGTRGRGAH
jgi:hypothetical protein